MNPNNRLVLDAGMLLSEYFQYCCTGKLPQAIAALKAKSPLNSDLIDLLNLLGYLYPACAVRPDPCQPEILVTRSVEVAAATLNPDGTVTASEEHMTSICAPMNKALMVKELEVSPANLTAEEQPVTQPIYKRVNIATFGEWCLPFDPPDAPGLFVSVQNILVPPKTGFSVYVQNYDPANVAIYRLRGKMWSCC